MKAVSAVIFAIVAATAVSADDVVAPSGCNVSDLYACLQGPVAAINSCVQTDAACRCLSWKQQEKCFTNLDGSKSPCVEAVPASYDTLATLIQENCLF